MNKISIGEKWIIEKVELQIAAEFHLEHKPVI